MSKEEAYASVGTTCVSEPPENNQRGQFYLYCRQNGIWPKEVTSHDPKADPKWFTRYCPVLNVSAEYPPTVLIHGTADTDVPYEEAVNMDEALTRFKVAHKFITALGGGHGLRGVPENEQAHIYERALRFVKEHTRQRFSSQS